MDGIVSSRLALAVVTWLVRPVSLPVVRNLPVREFSSGRVWRKRDAPPCCCGPKPPAQTVPGTVCLTSAVIIHFGLSDQSNKKAALIRKAA